MTPEQGRTAADLTTAVQILRDKAGFEDTNAELWSPGPGRLASMLAASALRKQADKLQQALDDDLAAMKAAIDRLLA